MASENLGNIYKELGATPIINAIGSVTMLGGSTPIPEVREAMALAGDSYIHLMELEEKAGGAIADMVGVPAAYITCLLYTSPSPRDGLLSRMPSSA